MMKYEELRLGNLLKRDIPDGANQVIGEEIVTLCAVAKPQSFIALKEDIKGNHVMSWAIEFVKPIPLTEDWLLKFGFFYWEKIDEWGSDDENSILRINHYTSGEEIGFFETVYWVKLKYVHQLQNLYLALTNEELIINEEAENRTE